VAGRKRYKPREEPTWESLREGLEFLPRSSRRGRSLWRRDPELAEIRRRELAARAREQKATQHRKAVLKKRQAVEEYRRTHGGELPGWFRRSRARRRALHLGRRR
jgi:hypothetical protein